MAKQNVKAYEVAYSMDFTKVVEARDADYALQKARYQAETRTPGDLLEKATDIKVRVHSVMGAANAPD